MIMLVIGFLTILHGLWVSKTCHDCCFTTLLDRIGFVTGCRIVMVADVMAIVLGKQCAQILDAP